MSGSVLFDAPGPRTRRRVTIASVVTGVVIAGALALVVLRLVDAGQFDGELWAPLLNPATEEFPLVWGLIGSGLSLTLRAAALAMVASLLIGVVIAVLRLLLGRVARLPVVGVVELLRGLPVVVTIVFASALLPLIGLDVEPFWFLVVGLTAYNCVVISEILRAGVTTLPKGQVEAALAVGLTRGQTMRLVQLPQAFRAMLPALISQLVVILKDTAIGSIVLTGLQDTLYQGDLIRRNLDNALQTYTVVAVIFIVLCLLLSRLAVWVERRLSRGSKGASQVPEVADANAT